MPRLSHTFSDFGPVLDPANLFLLLRKKKPREKYDGWLQWLEKIEAMLTKDEYESGEEDEAHPIRTLDEDLGLSQKLKMKSPAPKNETEKQLIAKALYKNETLKQMVHLDEAKVKAMVEVAWKAEVSEGKKIIREGELNAFYFYIVQEGQFDVTVLDEGESKFAGSVTKGGSFGEFAILFLTPRAASVKANMKSVVWVIHRQDFKSILMKASSARLAEYRRYLDHVEMLSPLLGEEEKKALSEALVEMHFSKGEVIVKQGNVASAFYILYDGEVSIQKDGREQTKLNACPSRKTAQFFGERALMNAEPRAASVVASTFTKALLLDIHSFSMVLGPLEEIMKRSQENRSTVGPMKIGRVYSERENITWTCAGHRVGE